MKYVVRQAQFDDIYMVRQEEFYGMCSATGRIRLNHLCATHNSMICIITTQLLSIAKKAEDETFPLIWTRPTR